MQFDRRKITIIAAVVFVAATGILIYLAYRNVSATQNQTTAQTNIDKTLNDTVGGYVTGDGFEFSKIETEQIYSLTITKEPFETYLGKAYDWMRSQGLDPATTPRICFVGQGVTNVTNDQISKCSTATLGN